MTMPMAPQGPPPIPPKPFTPFDQLGNETEPEVAGVRMRRLSRLMSTARFKAQPPEWRQLVVDEYNASRQAVAQATQGQQPGGDQSMQQFDAKIAQLVKNSVAAFIAKADATQLGASQPTPPSPSQGG